MGTPGLPWVREKIEYCHKNPVMACRLCQENEKLCKSHIIPQVYYKDAYYSKNRLPMISSNPNDKIKIYQSGAWEQLLCEECEGYINNSFEKYAQTVIYDLMPSLKIQEDHAELVLEGINYVSFKLFQLSILWRAGPLCANISETEPEGLFQGGWRMFL